MQVGSRIGLALAVLGELFVGAYFGLIAAILAALAVPFVGEALDCMMLIVAIVLAVIGFYLGMLAGLIAWSFNRT